MTENPKPYTILRTAVGFVGSRFLLERLREIPGVKLIGTDASQLAFGSRFVDAFSLVPMGNAPDYVEQLLQLCRRESVDLLLPCADEELAALAPEVQRFQDTGTLVMISSPPVIRTCYDKWLTYLFFREHDFRSPESWLPENLSSRLEFPAVIKPRSGRGSRGFVKIRNETELEFFSHYLEDPIVQQYVDGTEYTIDTISDLEGKFLYCAIRERIETDSGLSVKGRAIRDSSISETVEHLCNKLRIIGPGCIQGIVPRGKPNSAIRFIEVNPRLSGGLPLSVAAGAPLITDMVRLARGEAIEGIRNFREGTVMLRYWCELFS